MSTKQELGSNQSKWLDALRSGRYSQGKDYLRCGDNYCCLGVAAELFDVPSSVDCLNESDGSPIYEFGGDVFEAPLQVLQNLALYGFVGEPAPDAEGILGCLTELNDGGKSFSEIADIIEADPAVFFEEPR